MKTVKFSFNGDSYQCKPTQKNEGVMYRKDGSDEYIYVHAQQISADVFGRSEEWISEKAKTCFRIALVLAIREFK